MTDDCFAFGALLLAAVSSACSNAGRLEFVGPGGGAARSPVATSIVLELPCAAPPESTMRLELAPIEIEGLTAPALDAAEADRRAGLAIRRRFDVLRRQRALDDEFAHSEDFARRGELESESIENRLELDLAEAELRAADPLANLRWVPRTAPLRTTEFSAIYAADSLEDLAVESVALEQGLLRDSAALLAAKHARGDDDIESGPYVDG